MADAASFVARALSGDRPAIDALVPHLIPYVQRQVNAGLLRRRLVPQAGRHDVVDLVRDLLVALFDEQGALLGQWDRQTPLEGFVEYLAFGQVAAVLDRVAPLPPDAPPPPGEAEAWWTATATQDPSSLPVPEAARPHAQAILRPVEAHEAQAIAAEVHRAIVSAPPPEAASTPPQTWTDPTAGGRRDPEVPDARRRRRGLVAAAILAVGVLTAVVGATVTGVGDEDRLPRFRVDARDGVGGEPPRYAVGQPIAVALVPARPIDLGGTTTVGEAPDLTVAAVAVGAAGAVARWPYALEQDAQGTLRLSGAVGEDLPVTPGVWRLVFVIGPREELLGDATVLAQDPEPPPPPLQRLQYTILVQAP